MSQFGTSGQEEDKTLGERAGQRGIRGGTLAMLALAIMTVAVSPAAAGRAQSGFQAVLRIDAELVRRDLERQGGSVTVEPTSAPAAAKTTRSTAPRVLPRAGGGVCVRRWVSRIRFRWVCK